jgi:hypothetical protein
VPNELERRSIAALIEKAKKMGLGDQVPPVLLNMVEGHGPSNGGAIGWDRLHPDDDQFYGCCWGDTNKGPAYCTCWVPEFDLPQTDPIAPADGEVQVRPGGLCGDCAYRPGSPEMAEDYSAETLRSLPAHGQTFWCHDGIRRPTRWVHPDGRVVDGAPDDYQPPIVAGRPHRADGRVGHLCAGWAACGRRLDNLAATELHETLTHSPRTSGATVTVTQIRPTTHPQPQHAPTSYAPGRAG